jgi:hypothetical protein
VEPSAEAMIAIPARMIGAWNRGDAAGYFAGDAVSVEIGGTIPGVHGGPGVPRPVGVVPSAAVVYPAASAVLAVARYTRGLSTASPAHN